MNQKSALVIPKAIVCTPTRQEYNRFMCWMEENTDIHIAEEYFDWPYDVKEPCWDMGSPDDVWREMGNGSKHSYEWFIGRQHIPDWWPDDPDLVFCTVDYFIDYCLHGKPDTENEIDISSANFDCIL